MRWAPRLVAAIALAGAVGCRDNPPPVYPTVAPVEEAELTLGPGDKLEIQYIGTVAAATKTAKAVQLEIQQKLADGYLINPIVSLSVLEINSRKLSVLGQVAKSGSIKFTPGMTITEAIAQSGGFSPMARKNMVKVTRLISGKPEIYKVPVEMIAEGSRPNFPMAPGDEIFVPERAW